MSIPVIVAAVVGLLACLCCCCCCFCLFLGRKGQAGRADGADEKSREESDSQSVQYPKYWANLDSSESFDKRYEQPDLVEVVQKMFDTTWKTVVTRDRKGGAPSRLEVVSVSRFEDSDMWAKYHDQKKQISTRGVLPSIMELDGDFAAGHVLTDAFARHLTHGAELDRGLNEHYLFHGTSPEAAESIAESGFRLNLAGTHAGTMFGKGAYFGECASKADEYASAGSGVGQALGFRGFAQANDEFAILVCRVCCGKVFRALRASDKSEFLPLIEQGAIDGVLGDREASVGTYREFVVFNEAQVYPEYRVIYRRKF